MSRCGQFLYGSGYYKLYCNIRVPLAVPLCMSMLRYPLTCDACHKSGEEGNKENGAEERNCPHGRAGGNEFPQWEDCRCIMRDFLVLCSVPIRELSFRFSAFVDLPGLWLLVSTA